MQYISKMIFWTLIPVLLALTMQTASGAQPARVKHRNRHGHKGHSATHHHANHHSALRNQ